MEGKYDFLEAVFKEGAEKAAELYKMGYGNPNETKKLWRTYRRVAVEAMALSGLLKLMDMAARQGNPEFGKEKGFDKFADDVMDTAKKMAGFLSGMAKQLMDRAGESVESPEGDGHDELKKGDINDGS